jgi:hypothetical protein
MNFPEVDRAWGARRRSARAITILSPVYSWIRLLLFRQPEDKGAGSRVNRWAGSRYRSAGYRAPQGKLRLALLLVMLTKLRATMPGRVPLCFARPACS